MSHTDSISPNEPNTAANKVLDALEELEALLRRHPEALKDANRMVNKEAAKQHERKHAVRVPPVRQYTQVLKQTTCLHCGHQYEKLFRLSPKEYMGLVDHEGHYKEVRFSIVQTEIVPVKHYVSQCKECIKMVKGWYREELEYRYLNLLQEFSVLHANRKVWNADGDEEEEAG
jgi:hypothetical protein